MTTLTLTGIVLNGEESEPATLRLRASGDKGLLAYGDEFDGGNSLRVTANKIDLFRVDDVNLNVEDYLFDDGSTGSSRSASSHLAVYFYGRGDGIIIGVYIGDEFSTHQSFLATFQGDTQITSYDAYLAYQGLNAFVPFDTASLVLGEAPVLIPFSAATAGTLEIDELLFGTPEDNTINGGTGQDTIRGLEGDDILLGNSGDDRLYGGADSDILSGGRGKDRLTGGAAGDLLDGGKGDDILRGSGGKDELNGNRGQDKLRGGGGNDTLNGNAGDDFMKGSSGDDAIDGGTGDDLLNGNSGNDTLNGGRGDDILTGGSGDDVLDGGSGNDLLEGGFGSDVFLIDASAAGTDSIEDFKASKDTVTLLKVDGLVRDDIGTIGDFIAEYVFDSDTTSFIGDESYDLAIAFDNGELMLIDGSGNLEPRDLIGQISLFFDDGTLIA